MPVTPLTQPTAVTCVHTCLAMVTGCSIDDLIERFGDQPLGPEVEELVLVEHRIFPRSTTGNRHMFPAKGTYLVTVPSLNLPGRLHLIVLESTHDEHDQPLYRIHDPNAGREGVKVYTDECLYSGDIAIVGATYLDYEVLRHMRPAA